MKKIFLAVVVALFSINAMAQHEIGAVVGGMNGASYKYWFNDAFALQADLAVGLTRVNGGVYNKSGNVVSGDFGGYYDFTINPNALYHFELPDNFKIYTGGGISFGLLSHIQNTATDGIMGKFGINAVAGVSYDFDNVPLVLAFDFRPGYGLGFQGNNGRALAWDLENGSAHISYFDWKIAFAVRYKL